MIPKAQRPHDWRAVAFFDDPGTVAHPMAYRWETPASVWLEDESNGQFELAASEGLGRIDWSRHARGAWPTSPTCSAPRCRAACEGCEHSSIYPEGFSFCPNAAARSSAWPGASSAARLVGPACRPAAAAPRAAWLARHLAAAGRQPRGTSRRARVGRFDAVDAAAAECRVRVRRRRLRLPGTAPAGAGAGARRAAVLGSAGRSCGMCWCRKRARPSLRFTLPTTAGCRPWSRARGEVGLVPTAQGLYRLWINPINETCRTEPCWPRRWSPRRALMRRQLACLVRGNAGVLVPVDAGCRAGAGAAIRMRRAAAVRLDAADRLRRPAVLAARRRPAAVASGRGAALDPAWPTPGCRASSSAARP
jgi:hypothetical protein